MSERLSKSKIKWVRSLQQKKHRQAEGVFVAEGLKCVNELQKAFELVLLITPENASPTEIEQMSSLRTPQGVIGIFKCHPHHNSTIDYNASNKLIVALDGIQDPGNLGTIIRTCDWFGVHNIICSQETADCYNPKVVQATMGALARVHIQYVEDLAEELLKYKSNQVAIYGTLLNGKNMYTEGHITNKKQAIIVMGNEGNGLSDAVRRVITHPILIPPYPTNSTTSESLNVSIATAIILAEFRRS